MNKAPRPVSIDLDLLEQIHDVPLGRASWAEVLDQLKSEFSTEHCLLIRYGSGPRQARSLVRAVVDERTWHLYAEYFVAIDPFVAAMGGAEFPPGVVRTGDQVVPAKEFCASEFFNDWFKPGGMRHTAGAFLPIPGGDLLQLGMPRAPEAGAFSVEEIRRLQRYFNHIARAVCAHEEIMVRPAAPDFDRFARNYGLTPAEAKLLEGLAETGSLRRTAERTHRSYLTLRAQLRSIFLKTGARSQVELMRLSHQGGPGPEAVQTGRFRSS